MGIQIIQFILAFLVPVVLSILLTPLAIKAAYKIGAVDKPDERKVHKNITPRLGGLAIFLTLAISSVLAFTIFDTGQVDISEHYQKILLVGGALTLVFLLGVWDDVTPLKPGLKFGLQFVIATLVYLAGVKISSVMNPLSTYALNVQFIDYPLTVLWIIGITNAINLIDGLDGLATGVSTIACVSIFAVSSLTGEIGNAYIALILAGSLVGFLRYNFNPARIFLGDSGSLLLGFLLAILSIQSSNKISTGFSIFFPIIVLGLPITDTLIAMIRRFLGTFLEKDTAKTAMQGRLKKMFLPDKSHIHHQLLAYGFTHRNTVILLYFISAFFAVSAFSITVIDSYSKSVIALGITVFILLLGVKKLRYREIDIFNNGIFLPFYERFWLNRTSLKVFFDLVFIITAFTLSLLAIQWTNSSGFNAAQFQIILVVAAIAQFITLWMVGIYNDSYNLIGLGDALKITKAVAYSTLSLIPVFFFLSEVKLDFFVPFLILNFYLLLTFVLGFRISHKTLRYLFFRTSKAENNVLIYGANASGELLLDQIMAFESPTFNVLGFIDEDHQKEGTQINGFKIFGGHWKLERLIRSKKVDMILMADSRIKPEVMKRIKSLSEKYQLPIMKFHLDLESVVVHENAVENQPVFGSKIAISN
ncbi:hypothetical protein [Gracilimonas amylolytica]|uniref:hypothetical protein n=1 Tax=Gracilimonas amylolytica TaxID=1749045 RepID=UPI000CD89936|nr:hypothetical protein [Gracilimonas amylolytica]